MRIISMFFVLVWLSMSGFAEAQLATEAIPLQSGWNAVWVNLEPEPNDLQAIFAQQQVPLDYQAIWMFDADRAGDFTTSGIAGRWFFYDKDVPFELTTLRTLHGHRAYYIKMHSAGQLRLTGRPLFRATQFTSRVSNLIGALTDQTSSPLSFENFFSHPNAKGKVRTSGTPIKHDIFALIGDVLVRKQILDAIQPNAAYWLNVVQDFAYSGPLDATTNSNGLSFGRSTAQRTLSIEIPASPSARTITIQARTCAVLSPAGGCSSAESVEWLEYRDPAQPGLQVWRPLSEGLAVVVPSGAPHVEVELRARRAGLESFARRRGESAGVETFPAVIDIADQQGSRAVISADVSVEPIFGRWVGRAELTHVSTHPSIQNLLLDQAEADPLGMALILDLPTPSATAVAASPRLLDTLTIHTFRDGRNLLRRFSSVLFDRPVTLVEDAADPIDPLGTTGTLRGTLHIPPDDALNPYRHRYNPEHRRGYDITRQITIQLQPQAPTPADEFAGLDGTFGTERLTGLYTEVITGVTLDPITVQGTFRLERLNGEIVSP